MTTLLNNTVQKALTTLTRAKSFLGISSTKHDTLLTMLINQATGAIEQYVRRRLLSQTYTEEQYDGKGSMMLILKQFPVTTFTKLEQNLTDDNTDDWEEIDTEDYFWHEDGRVQSYNFTFVAKPQKYRVTYVAGYLIDFDNENDRTKHTLPFEIEYACHKIISALFNTRRASGLEQSRIGDSSVTIQTAIMSDSEVRDILDRYKAPLV